MKIEIKKIKENKLYIFPALLIIWLVIYYSIIYLQYFKENKLVFLKMFIDLLPASYPCIRPLARYSLLVICEGSNCLSSCIIWVMKWATFSCRSWSRGRDKKDDHWSMVCAVMCGWR